MKTNALKNRSEFLSANDIQAIHAVSMQLLSEVGIRFPDEAALNTFRKHGARTAGQIVYLSEDQVMSAIASAPTQFTVHARNPARNVIMGDGYPVFAPGYGPPFLIDTDGVKRTPTITDYHNIAKLTQVLPNQDMSGHLMVMPGDIPGEIAPLEMLKANILHADKAFIGSTDGAIGANNTIELARILFGEGLAKPVTIGIINPISPLGYSPDMLKALMAYTQAGQPCAITALAMAGSTGPVTLAGVLAQQNAEILAGIVLSQLVLPGTPVLYGSTSSNIDMCTGALSIGSPELSLCIVAHAQLSRFYGLPSRGGGGLTDSRATDAQSGFESMFSLLTTINSGIDFVLHSAGILNTFMAFSYEKFILDDEMIGMLRSYMQGVEVTPDTLAYDVIAAVGHGGHFLGEDHTLERCRSAFWEPAVADRNGFKQPSDEQQDIAFYARQRWHELLESHEDPPLGKVVLRQLQAYIEKNT